MTQSNIHADLQPRFPEADPAYIDSLPFRTIDRYAQLPLSRSAVLLSAMFLQSGANCSRRHSIYSQFGSRKEGTKGPNRWFHS